MKKLGILFIILFSHLFSFGQAPTQQDTVFFDSDWKICNKAKASFYRVVEPQLFGGYRIRDMYLKTNTPQMIGFSETLDTIILESKCTYYYPNGNKQREGFYADKKATGIWTEWSKNGKDSTFVDYSPRPKQPNVIKFEPYLYNKEQPFSFALRGKTGSFFVIEDAFFFNSTLGTELRYKKQSIGIDATWFRWRYETDNMSDVGMYSQYELRTYLYVDYKFTFISFEQSQVDLYVNMYGKTGKYKMWYDPYEDYDHGTTDWTFLQSTAKGTFNEPGLGLGFRKYAEKTGFGLDGSANVGYRVTDTNELTYISQTETDFKNHVKDEKYLFYIRLNAFFVFGQ